MNFAFNRKYNKLNSYNLKIVRLISIFNLKEGFGVQMWI